MRLSAGAWEAIAGSILTAACALAIGSLNSATPASAAPIGPEVAPSETPMREHAESVGDYTLEARLDPFRHVVQGTGTIAWRNRSTAPVRELWVHLYLNAFKNTESAFLRERTPGAGRGSGPVADFGWIDVRKFSLREDANVDLWPGAQAVDPTGGKDTTDMRVPLTREIMPGEQVHFDIAWESKLPTIVERTGYHGSFHLVAQWFPKIAKLEQDGSFAHFPFHHLAEFYADFGRFDVTLRAPAAYRFAATGVRSEERMEGGERVERYAQGDIHDFAFAAWDQFAVEEREADGVKVTSWHPRGFEQVARQQLDAAEVALRHFGQRYGRYPYPTLAIVHPPRGAEEAGGMEYPTMITTGGSWFVPRSIGYVRALAIHELAHQYFYGLVASNEQRWPFLDEGLGSWAELKALDAEWGPGSIGALWRLKVSAATTMRIGALWGGNDERIAQPANDFDTASSYGTLVYARTATILETLDRVWPGKITTAAGSYAREHRFEHPVPEDLERAVERAAGAEAARQLHVALFERGGVDYAAQSLGCDAKRGPYGAMDQPSGRAIVTETEASAPGHRCTAVVARRGSLVFPVEVELIAEDGTRVRHRWDGAGEAHTVTHEGPSRIVAMVVDPEHTVLLDEDLTNNAVSTRGKRSATRVWEAMSFAATMAMIGGAP